MSTESPTVIDAFRIVEEALRKHNVVAVALVDETDEYDAKGVVQVYTFEGRPNEIPKEHPHSSTLLAAFIAAGGEL